MTARKDQILHSYKIRWSDELFLFLVNNLLMNRLGYKPQRWHLETHKRHKVDPLGNPVTYTWHLIHVKHNGSWRTRYVSKQDIRELLNLATTVTNNS